MDNYKILYQELLKLKNELDSKIASIENNISFNEKEIKNSEQEIDNLENDKERKQRIYNLLFHYKDFINEEIIRHIKFGGIVFWVFALIISIMVMIVSLLSQQLLLNGIFGGIIVSLGIGAFIGGKTFLADTRLERDIYKEKNHMLPYFPLMLSTLDKQIHFEYQSKLIYEEELDSLSKEKESVEIKKIKVLAYMEYILKKLPEVEYICRHQNDVINEVYNNDKQIENIITLVRKMQEEEKNAS